ncbi:hypothetical protein PIB30_071244 [Stylosanthes scabra]|uniref:Uncharacterized protein n=1 Tax=Stylosanthes scabra TaxID=79078 RepID=A0ABU6WNF6_9FABA|nr:hypothetical protein [Stylosanthes scabra]
MPWPPVDSTLQEGEGEDIALEEELARQAGRIYLRWDGGNCWNKVRKGTTKISWVFYNYYREFLVEFWRQEDFKKLKEVNKQNRASSTGGSLHTGGSTTYEATRDRMTVELGCTPTHSEVFEGTHTRKEDQLWVDKRSVDEAFLAELKRLQAERQALMEAGCPKPPPIDEAALWTRFAGGRKRGRIYGMGVVPSHQHPPLFPDDEDADTASAPDLRERVVMLNREILQQAEANARRLLPWSLLCRPSLRRSPTCERPRRTCTASSRRCGAADRPLRCCQTSLHRHHRHHRRHHRRLMPRRQEPHMHGVVCLVRKEHPTKQIQDIAPSILHEHVIRCI